MNTIYILNIPNFYSSYYLYGFSKMYKLKYKPDVRFLKYNNKPVIIFQFEDKLGVVNNDDPVYFDMSLYEVSDAYFVTNKLLESDDFSRGKVKPLFPHYPINIVPLYLKLFRFNLYKYLTLKNALRQIYTLYRRPIYKSHKSVFKKENYVFFSSSIWKKERETNSIRAEFIRYCKADNRVNFEGGFIPRSDGDNLGFNNEVNTVRYKPKQFSKLSAKSKIALNNAAVWGAVSWRLAEYLNQGLFVLSFPFKIELPKLLQHNLNVCFVKDVKDFSEVFNKVFDGSNYHETIAENGKLYFETYCTPLKQAEYIINILKNS